MRHVYVPLISFSIERVHLPEAWADKAMTVIMTIGINLFAFTALVSAYRTLFSHCG